MKWILFFFMLNPDDGSTGVYVIRVADEAACIALEAQGAADAEKDPKVPYTSICLPESNVVFGGE